MNKHRFRLIFSKSLGFLIPVAETTRAQRKPGQTSCNVASSTSPFFSLKRLAASLLLAGLPGWAFAELVVDPARGGETNVISAPNGVPVIEIANPNGKGLSHNRFSEFDVSKPGVIFNNSQSNGVSQLGGALLRNPNLQRQATAILSEVTGNKPSSISGTLEVFGGRADILIANGNLPMGEYMKKYFSADDVKKIEKQALWYERAKPVVEKLQSRGWSTLGNYFSESSAGNRNSDLHELARDLFLEGTSLYRDPSAAPIEDVLSFAIDRNVKVNLIDEVKWPDGVDVMSGDAIGARNDGMADLIKSRPKFMRSGVLALFGADHLKSKINSKAERTQSMQELTGLPAERVYDLSPLFIDYSTGDQYYSFKEQAGISYSAISNKTPYKVRHANGEEGQDLITYKMRKNTRHVVINAAGSDGHNDVQKIRSKHPETTIVFDMFCGSCLMYAGGQMADYNSSTNVYVLKNKEIPVADSEKMLSRLADKLRKERESFTMRERYVLPTKALSDMAQKKAVEQTMQAPKKL